MLIARSCGSTREHSKCNIPTITACREPGNRAVGNLGSCNYRGWVDRQCAGSTCDGRSGRNHELLKEPCALLILGVDLIHSRCGKDRTRLEDTTGGCTGDCDSSLTVNKRTRPEDYASTGSEGVDVLVHAELITKSLTQNTFPVLLSNQPRFLEQPREALYGLSHRCRREQGPSILVTRGCVIVQYHTGVQVHNRCIVLSQTCCSATRSTRSRTCRTYNAVNRRTARDGRAGAVGVRTRDCTLQTILIHLRSDLSHRWGQNPLGEVIQAQGKFSRAERDIRTPFSSEGQRDVGFVSTLGNHRVALTDEVPVRFTDVDRRTDLST